MAEINHTLLETIQMAIKLSKLEQHPVGSLWATMSDDDPAVVFGGGWKKLGECILHGSEQASIIQGTSGAITLRTKYNSYRTPAQLTESPGATSGGSFIFRASSYNPIYGKSDTVQMKSIYANIWQRVS